jgi:hypothetical protein
MEQKVKNAPPEPHGQEDWKREFDHTSVLAQRLGDLVIIFTFREAAKLVISGVADTFSPQPFHIWGHLLLRSKNT